MDIIVLALSRWDGKFSSTILSMGKVFAIENRVFYIGNPFSIRELVTRFFSRQIKEKLPAILFGHNTFSAPMKELPRFIAITPMATLSINWLPKGKLYSYLQKVNDQIVYRAVQKAIRQHGIKDFLYINSFNPLFGNYFPAAFRPAVSVYHCVDDIRKSPHISRHGPLLEKKTIGRADVVITTSRELARLKSKESSNVHIVPNAANVALFQQAAHRVLDMPLEIQQISRGKKIITYVGNVCHRLDYGLLKAIADRLPRYTLLMVGPLSNNLYKQSGLVQRRNVVFTGSKTLEELPAYLQYSHCCIIPFLCNTLTKSIYPLKINEYLSAGKPVVTTPFSEDIKSFEGVVHISAKYDDFVSNIIAAIVNDSPDLKSNRVAYSANNSWEDRATEFWKIIEKQKKHEKEEHLDIQEAR